MYQNQMKSFPPVIASIRRAIWDQDGSALTAILDRNDVCPLSLIKDVPQAILTLEEMTGQQRLARMEDFGLSTVAELEIEEIATAAKSGRRHTLSPPQVPCG
jgi:hypothetical protein